MGVYRYFYPTFSPGKLCVRESLVAKGDNLAALFLWIQGHINSRHCVMPFKLMAEYEHDVKRAPPQIQAEPPAGQAPSFMGQTSALGLGEDKVGFFKVATRNLHTIKCVPSQIRPLLTSWPETTNTKESI